MLRKSIIELYEKKCYTDYYITLTNERGIQMNDFKKLFAMVLCLMLLLGNLVYADEVMLISAPVEKDYEGHWAQATIEKWQNEGRVSGYPDGSYKPDNKVTRAEFVKMVNGIIDYSKVSDIKFNDVPESEWYYKDVRIAQSIGYISGYSLSEFGPNDYITREQAASILARVQYLKNNSAGTDKFSDNNSLSSWAVEAVGATSEAGFISGYVDGSFRPQKSLTRAEAITMLDNVLVNGKNKVVYNDGTELKDLVIEGDLIIAKTVGEGNVYLTNIDVKGGIQVYGGGINSIYFKNVKVAEIEVLKDKVRLVFEDGSTVENIEAGTETIIENIDGEIQKITITDKKGVVLTGNLGEVTISGTEDITLKNAVIDKLIVEDKVTIYGKGTVKTLEAKADGIKYEAAVKVDKVELGEGVKTAPEAIKDIIVGGGSGGSPGGDPTPANPNIQIIIKTADQDTGVAFNSKTYKESDNDKFKVFFVQEIKSIFNKTSNSSAMDGYITQINDRIDKIYVGDVKLYSDDGWGKAIAYLDGTEVKDDAEAIMTVLLDGDISNDDINAIFALYDKFGTGDNDKIKDKLASLDDKNIKYNGQDVEYKLTYKDIEITKNSEIAEFILDEILFSGKSVKEFFDEYGEVVFTATYEGKTSVITLKTVTLK